MKHAGYPDGVSQATHDAAYCPELRSEVTEQDDEARNERAGQIAARDMMIERATTDYAAAQWFAEQAGLLWTGENGWFLADVLAAVCGSRVEASCFTDGDRLAALQARIEKALRPIAERIVAEAA